MLLFTLLNICATTGQTSGQTTCKECDEIGKIEKSANEWGQHTQDSQKYEKQLRENARWRRKKHPYHAPQKAIAKANSTNTINVSTPININNTNNSSSTNIISISKTNVPSTAAVPEVSVSTTVPDAARKTSVVSAAPATTSTTTPALIAAPTAPIKA